MKRNWKTTAVGVALLIGTLAGVREDPARLAEEKILAQIAVAVGFLVARDSE